MILMKFPENDPIKARLESVEQNILSFYEETENHINLDACLISVQNALFHYRLFIGEGCDNEQDQETSSNE